MMKPDQPCFNPNPRLGVWLRIMGASVRLYNVMNPRFGRRGLNWFLKHWPEERRRRELRGYGPGTSREFGRLLALRQRAAEPRPIPTALDVKSIIKVQVCADEFIITGLTIKPRDEELRWSGPLVLTLEAISNTQSHLRKV